MKITVTYRLSEAGQKAALVAKLNAAVNQSTEIDDPDNTLIDDVTINNRGEAHIDLALYQPSLKRTYRYFDSNVLQNTLVPELTNDGPTWYLDRPIASPADVRAALAEHRQRGKTLLESLPAEQAKLDADFEARKAIYLDQRAKEAAERAAAKIRHEERERLEAEAAASAPPPAKTVNRIALTDVSGRWFEANKARKFKEDTYWDGSNHISIPTGSQWDHEALYRTASCRYILNHWSQRSGSSETYEEISKHEAAGWLVRNGHEDPECVLNEIAALEIQ